MSIIREFEVFLTETVCCFRCCLSVVSVVLVLVVGSDSFGIVCASVLCVVLVGFCSVDVVQWNAEG
jgi:hypothetical protein